MGQLKTLAVICLSGALLAGVGCRQNHDKAEAHKEIITKTAAPSPVTAAFEKEYPAASITKIEKETYKDGTSHYEYQFFLNGKKHKVAYDARGDKLE